MLKLVVDEETPKYNKVNFDMSSVQPPTQPPPNLAPPSQEKWYYQDPQVNRIFINTPIIRTVLRKISG